MPKPSSADWRPPFLRPRKPKAKLLKRQELAPHLQAAVTLGERVAEFLKHYGAASDSASAKTAAALYGELRDALARFAEMLPAGSGWQARDWLRRLVLPPPAASPRSRRATASKAPRRALLVASPRVQPTARTDTKHCPLEALGNERGEGIWCCLTCFRRQTFGW